MMAALLSPSVEAASVEAASAGAGVASPGTPACEVAAWTRKALPRRKPTAKIR
jgi:hypothetical protein